MHEYALADAVLKAALRSAQEERLARVTRIRVEVGELQQIDRDVFAFALGEVRPPGDVRFATTVVEVVLAPARFACRACGRSFTLAEAGDRDGNAAEAIHFVPEAAHAFLRCPACSSPDFEVTAGRGVSIAALEGERADA
jgi:hydrogenase nickel incorporation protein HypA/HybF